MRIRLDRLKWNATYNETDTVLGEMGEWPVAERYNVIGGRICPTGPRVRERTFPARSPLLDNKLAHSFAQLGARGKPSKEKVLPWVRRYGLLTRKDNERPAKRDLDDGTINQAPITLEDFSREVELARGLLTLYVQLLGEDTQAILERIERPKSIVDQDLSTHFASMSKNEWTSLTAQMDAFMGGARSVALYAADQVLCSLLNDAVGGIKLQAFPSYRSSDEQPRQYQPWRSWYCPDLLSAIYLQIYLLVTGNVPMRICKNPHCRTPFPVTRKDKWVCKDGCRSTIRGS